ncbi:hypothetical protein GCM10023320_50120 [Pseudonocardia adelaidensis]|uniref:Uncharacterized protein n=1 Tax=Pseudonocardia adelaidensis TaxID=648754 RepID=A0ABP9NUE4_9PSEU
MPAAAAARADLEVVRACRRVRGRPLAVRLRAAYVHAGLLLDGTRGFVAAVVTPRPVGCGIWPLTRGHAGGVVVLSGGTVVRGVLPRRACRRSELPALGAPVLLCRGVLPAGRALRGRVRVVLAVLPHRSRGGGELPAGRGRAGVPAGPTIVLLLPLVLPGERPVLLVRSRVGVVLGPTLVRRGPVVACAGHPEVVGAARGIGGAVAARAVGVDPVGRGLPGLRRLPVLIGARGLFTGLGPLVVGAGRPLGRLGLAALGTGSADLRLVPVLGRLDALLLLSASPALDGEDRDRSDHGQHHQHDDDRQPHVHPRAYPLVRIGNRTGQSASRRPGAVCRAERRKASPRRSSAAAHSATARTCSA